MKKLVAVGVMAWLCHIGSASAGVPDWCKDASFNDRYDLKDLSKTDIDDADDVIKTFAMASCKPSAEVEANKGAIDKARQAWGKKLGMSEADWADAVAFANADGRPEDPDLSTKDIASFTAMDQYVVIKEGFGGTFSNPVYLTDMLEPNLTEVGRLAYILKCIGGNTLDVTDLAVPFAICQSDIDAFDAAKFAVQLRGDTAHPGDTKMKLRLLAYGLPARLKEHAANVAKIYKKDEAYKKLWDAAKKGRADWASLFAKNTTLLALATKMDTYFFTKSRKAFDGCAEATSAVLSATITAKVPAKLFKGKRDVRKELYEGVAKAVGPSMLDIPEIAFVAGPYIICHDNTGTAEFLSYYIDNVPGQRGPRAAAFTEITKAKIVLDDMSAKIRYETSWGHPFARSHGSLASTGAVIQSVKVDGDVLVVVSAPLPVKIDVCLSSRQTNRLSRIYYDGRLEYESICDKWGTKVINDAWDPFKINKSYQKLLKKGMLFSSVGSANERPGDVLAVWPSKDAALPTHVFGAPVK